jgi:translation elongation factor EF-1alpha
MHVALSSEKLFAFLIFLEIRFEAGEITSEFVKNYGYGSSRLKFIRLAPCSCRLITSDESHKANYGFQTLCSKLTVVQFTMEALDLPFVFKFNSSSLFPCIETVLIMSRGLVQAVRVSSQPLLPVQTRPNIIFPSSNLNEISCLYSEPRLI